MWSHPPSQETSPLAVAHQPAAAEPQAALDLVAAAKAARLRYVSDAQPGIRRRRAGKHFRYIDVDGQPVRDESTLQRIRSLAIPPAWTDVWICPAATGHLQATGRDARGRKQYRYHPRWREMRDETKYYRMLAFGAALPGIRERVDQDLSLPGFSRRKVLATVVRLLDETHLRVGNEEYARQNGSYGLTTLRTRHVDVQGSLLRFHFRGKGGIKRDVGVRDRRVASIIRRLKDLPGQHLFQYQDEDGVLQTVDSSDVNEYLSEISGQELTAKDFRTWAGTVVSALALAELGPCDSEAAAKRSIVRAIEQAAHRLGNTVTVCRKCYVHPEVLVAYLQGTTIRLEEQTPPTGLYPEEQAVMALLQERRPES